MTLLSHNIVLPNTSLARMTFPSLPATFGSLSTVDIHNQVTSEGALLLHIDFLKESITCMHGMKMRTQSCCVWILQPGIIDWSRNQTKSFVRHANNAMKGLRGKYYAMINRKPLMGY